MAKPGNKVFLALFLLTTAFNSGAAPVVFTDQAAFLGALPGAANTLDFDSLAAGTTIASGSAVGDITFNYDFGGVSMAITDGDRFGAGGPFDTTSGSNFLGTDDLDIFQGNDLFSMSFGPVNALGMFFITADEIFDDEIVLNAAGTSVGLLVADAAATLADGGVPFFLGIIDTDNTFTEASISTLNGDFFLYNVDDITTSVVPIPGALWLFVSGLLGLFAVRKRTGQP